MLLLLVIWKMRGGRGLFLHGGVISGHSAIAFFLATAILLLAQHPLISLLSLLLAALVSQSRVEAGVHTLREVILGELNRPEGLVFGPDGKLYITSFRDNSQPSAVGNTDMIRIYNGTTGSFIDKIDLDVVGQPRAFAQALLFGPHGRLFVPINGNGPDTGAVRRYKVNTQAFDVFVKPSVGGGALGSPFYLTFGKTNPLSGNTYRWVVHAELVSIS